VERHGDVLDATERGQQVEELKDEPDLVAPNPGQAVIVKAVEALAVDFNPARRRPVERTDEVEQCGFSRAGRPDNRHHLAAFDAEVNRVERNHIALSGIGLCDAADSNHGPAPPPAFQGRARRPVTSGFATRSRGLSGPHHAGCETVCI